MIDCKHPEQSTHLGALPYSGPEHERNGIKDPAMIGPSICTGENKRPAHAKPTAPSMLMVRIK